MSFLHINTFILSQQSPSKIFIPTLTLKSKVSCKYHLNHIWVRLEVQFILRQKFLSNHDPVKLDKLCAPQIRWWDRHRIAGPTAEGEMGACRASPKPGKANSIRSEGSRITLFGSRLCPPGPPVSRCHSVTIMALGVGPAPTALGGGCLACGN